MLILAATPIGNLGDASPRLVEALGAAPVIAAEDTRTAQHLMRALGVEARPRLVALHEHNERAVAAELVEVAREADVLVLTDAGMPAVSDPGFVVVEAAIAAGVGVTCIPGPSAVLTALAVSGLPTDRFVFEGFLPRKPGERARALAELTTERRTMVFFEAPHRTAATLAAMAEAFGDERPAAVCRELTKTYEEVRRGTISELATWAGEGVLGEVTIVVAGASAADRLVDLPTALARVDALVADGIRRKDACRQIAGQTGRSAKELYDAAVGSGPRRDV